MTRPPGFAGATGQGLLGARANLLARYPRVLHGAFESIAADIRRLAKEAW